jgi:hypothetical protein
LGVYNDPWWTDYKAWVMHKTKNVDGHLISLSLSLSHTQKKKNWTSNCAKAYGYLFSHKSIQVQWLRPHMLIGNGDEESTAITSFIIEGKRRDTIIALKGVQNTFTK